jgi:hypothetical protein
VGLCSVVAVSDGETLPTPIEKRFYGEILAGMDRLKREIGYLAPRFRQMVAQYGGVQAAKQLLRGRDASDGFTTLWEHHRLEMSVEATALLPWYRSLFDASELEVAERRLTEHGFDVERYLRHAAEQPPAWANNQSAN